MKYWQRILNQGYNRIEEIQIARDGRITDEEIPEFAYISTKLDEISLAVDALNLWVEKTAGENKLNVELLKKEKDRIKSLH